MDEVLAIDPGNEGAFVYLNRDGEFEFEKMPVKVTGKFKEVEFEAVLEILKRYKQKTVYLERAKPLAMGATHAFNYGRSFAAIEIAIRVSENPVVYVESHTWAKKMHAGISKDLRPKAKSVLAVERLFRMHLKKIPRSPKAQTLHEGVVDALLIAGYALAETK